MEKILLCFVLLAAAPIAASAQDSGAPDSGYVGAEVALTDGPEAPVILLDGSPITTDELKALDPAAVADIRIVRGAEALDELGDYAERGAVVVTSVAALPPERSDAAITTEPLGASDAPHTSARASASSNAGGAPAESTALTLRDDLYIVIDGRPATAEELRALDPAALTLDELPAAQAEAKYGEVAAAGALEVTTQR